uniref:Olfactory receptor family 10 subfamily J member 5 n=1 Tax=Cercocebus atys TaxID=9531 RepID=A0A2K5MX13_CERAT
MQRKNFTEVTEFILGFSSLGKHQITISGVFLTVCILTLAGNIIIVTIVCIDHHLHTPMCFFLSMLASSEMVYTLVIVPRLLCSLIFHNQRISLAGCATQMFFFVILAINNCFLLTAMGYDCYVAVCRPLRYTVIISKGLCAQLVFGSFGIGLIFTSYVLIISFFLKIASTEGWKKTFATCASHLTVVIVHRGCSSTTYLKPKSENSTEQDLLLSVTYTIIAPLLNPVVYRLRNKEVKDALCRVVGRYIS